MQTKLLNQHLFVLLEIVLLAVFSFAISEGHAADDISDLEQHMTQPPHPHVVVTNSGVKYLMHLSAAYFDIPPEWVGNVHGTRNKNVVRLLASGKRDIAIHSGALSDPELASLNKAFPQAKEFPQIEIGRFAVGVVVHSRTAVTSLTTRQLGDIMTGKVTNWQAVGAAPRLITVVGQQPKTNSAYILQQTCFPGQQITPQCVEKVSQAEVIAEVASTPSSIGFFLHEWDEVKGVRLLKIAPSDPSGKAIGPAVEPNDEAMTLGTYPLTDSLVAVLHPNASPETHDFMEFMRTAKAARIGKERRVFTLHRREDFLRKERLVSQQKGHGQVVEIVGLSQGEQLSQELSLKYVEAEELIQLRYRKSDSPAKAFDYFQRGGSELLITEGDVGRLEEQLKRDVKKISLGKQALGIIAHPKQKLTSITMEEMRQIATGEITHWPEAVGEGAMIRGYGLHYSHPVMEMYRERLAKREESDREGTGLLVNRRADNQQVILSVVKNPAGIGFVDLSQMPPLDGSVVLVGVVGKDGKVSQPTAGRLPENYPLAKPFTLFVSPTAGEAARKLADWLEENPCADVLARHHLLPPGGVQDAKTRELIADGSLNEAVEEALPPAEVPVDKKSVAEQRVALAVATAETAVEPVQAAAPKQSAKPKAGVTPETQTQLAQHTEPASPLVELDGAPNETALPGGVLVATATQKSSWLSIVGFVAWLTSMVVVFVALAVWWRKYRNPSSEENPLATAEEN